MGFFVLLTTLPLPAKLARDIFLCLILLFLVYSRGVRDGVKAGFSGYVNLRSGILPSLCKTLLVLNCSS